MAISMYQASVPVFVKTLGNLAAILDKAAAVAAAKKVDESVMLGLRLAPDMFSLARQIQQATVHAKGAPARLAAWSRPQSTTPGRVFAEVQGLHRQGDRVPEHAQAREVDGSEGRDINAQGSARIP